MTKGDFSHFVAFSRSRQPLLYNSDCYSVAQHICINVAMVCHDQSKILPNHVIATNTARSCMLKKFSKHNKFEIVDLKFLMSFLP